MKGKGFMVTTRGNRLNLIFANRGRFATFDVAHAEVQREPVEHLKMVIVLPTLFFVDSERFHSARMACFLLCDKCIDRLHGFLLASQLQVRIAAIALSIYAGPMH